MKVQTFEFLAKYKIGNVHFKSRTTVIARNIQDVSEVVEEVPEYTDGVLTRISYPSGQMVPSCEPYAVVRDRWLEALAKEESDLP